MRTNRSLEFSPGLCFLLGLSVMIPVAPEARLTLFDTIAPFLILHNWRTTQSLFKGAILLLGIGLLAMAFSAYLNESEPRALIGRAYQPIAFLAEAMAYCILIRGTSDRGRSSLVLGTMLGICCHYFYPSDLRVLDEPIKFLIGVPLGAGLLALYALAVPRASASMVLIIALMVVYALFCFLVGSRSIGGVYFVSAISVAALSLVRVPGNYAKFAPLTMLLAGLAIYGVTELYTILAINGLFGDRAAGIAAFQSSFGSILLGGRPEIIVNLSGIKDSPIFGVGILNYPSIYVYEMINLSIYSQQDIFDQGNILYHSAIFATAFESGVIAASLWIYILYRVVFVVPLISSLSVKERAFVVPLLLISIWHLLYSPPIPYNRFVMSIGLGFAFYIYEEWKQARQAALPNRQSMSPLPNAS